MNEETRERSLRETYRKLDSKDLERIMNLQVANRDHLAIRVLCEFGTKIPEYATY